MRNSVKHVIGVIGTEYYDMDKEKKDYGKKLLISKDVYEWLNQHDLRFNEKGRKIFIVNKVEYIDLGIDLGQYHTLTKKDTEKCSQAVGHKNKVKAKEHDRD